MLGLMFGRVPFFQLPGISLIEPFVLFSNIGKFSHFFFS